MTGEQKTGWGLDVQSNDSYYTVFTLRDTAKVDRTNDFKEERPSEQLRKSVKYTFGKYSSNYTTRTSSIPQLTFMPVKTNHILRETHTLREVFSFWRFYCPSRSPCHISSINKKIQVQMLRRKHTKSTNTSCFESYSPRWPREWEKGPGGAGVGGTWTRRIQPLFTRGQAKEFRLSLLRGEVFLIALSKEETLPVLELDSSTDCWGT